MRRILPVLLLMAVGPFHTAQQSALRDQIQGLPAEPALQRAGTDWLLDGDPYVAGVYRTSAPDEIVLNNGLVRRAFRLLPNAATVAYDDLMTGAALLRGVKPEAQVTLDGVAVPVGGLVGQPEYGYLRSEWIAEMTTDPAAFQCTGMRVGPTQAPFPWERVRYAEGRAWPPSGARLELDFKAPQGLAAEASVTLWYELYDGLPLLAKGFTLTNHGTTSFRLDSFVADYLAAVEPESDVEVPERWELPSLHVETDYSFGGFTPKSANAAVRWVPDPDYASQVNYQRQTPNLLVVAPAVGPGLEIAPQGTFESIRTFQLVFDSTERERRGLARRRMMRTIAPWSTENPILMHVRSSEPGAVRLAIDQCAEVGFEMVIMTFGSGFNMESEDPDYIREIKELVDYAHECNVELGGYSLLSSRRISDEHDVIDRGTGRPGGAKFGNAPCLESTWGQEYFRKIQAFIEKTGLDLLEHDGSYPGDYCASTSHPGHRDYEDSQWVQHKRIAEFYRWCRGRGVYLNVPDWYFLQGSNKIGMGYRETNWSLPRARQIVLGRQNIFDGTWIKTPSMGWMFVPLVEYHGGGQAATLEPLAEHLPAYEAHLANNFGSGVQACYRGPRLFDGPATKAVVQRWVDFYRRHREILDADVIHLRRPDGRDLDGLLHVHPKLQERALLMVHNPTDQVLRRTWSVPLYYSGLKDKAQVVDEDGRAMELTLDRDYSVDLELEVPPHGRTWFVFGER